VSPGEVYRHMFTIPGTYRYFCMPHESSGMLGQVVVEPTA
jgi:plastocyanin